MSSGFSYLIDASKKSMISSSTESLGWPVNLANTQSRQLRNTLGLKQFKSEIETVNGAVARTVASGVLFESVSTWLIQSCPLGNSMAAPHVTRVVALCLEENNLTPPQLKSAILDDARKGTVKGIHSPKYNGTPKHC